MAEMKIITHTTYSYETSDGREFDDENEAREWQNALSLLENVRMLDNEYKPVKDIEYAWYVHVETMEQVDAFNMIHCDLGNYSRLHGVGYHRYDDGLGEFLDVKAEIEHLQNIIDALDGKEVK